MTIVSVGFLNNLDDLLHVDTALVSRKVCELVIMGGRNNDDFNFVRHNLVGVTERVIRSWPTPFVVTDFGGDVRTGISLTHRPAANPVREAYFRWFDGAYKGRSSWDQIAILYGVRGASGYFTSINHGMGCLCNSYAWHLEEGSRTYIKPRLPLGDYRKLIDALMIKPPSYH